MYILSFIKPCIMPQTTHVILEEPHLNSNSCQKISMEGFVFGKITVSSTPALVELDFTRRNFHLE